jgi:hypothetical protein
MFKDRAQSRITELTSQLKRLSDEMDSMDNTQFSRYRQAQSEIQAIQKEIETNKRMVELMDADSRNKRSRT